MCLEQALTQAVLVVVAEAASGGQAGDLAAELPEEVGAYLRNPESARHTDTDRFLDEVVNLSTVTNPDLLRGQITAVFATLRQWAPGRLTEMLGQPASPIRELSP